MTTSTGKTAPNEQWTLDDLGEYVAKAARRTAETAWHIGTALGIAKRKCDAAGQGWDEWCQRHVPFMSDTTIWRYGKVAELPFDEIKGTQLKAVYARLASRPSRPKKPKDKTPNALPDDATHADADRLISLVPDYVTALEDYVGKIAAALGDGATAPDRTTLVRALILLMKRPAA